MAQTYHRQRPLETGLEERTPRESEGDPVQSKRRKKMDMEREKEGLCLIWKQKNVHGDGIGELIPSCMHSTNIY